MSSQSQASTSAPGFGFMGIVLATIADLIGAPARWFSEFMYDAEDIWDTDMFLHADDHWGSDSGSQSSF